MRAPLNLLTDWRSILRFAFSTNLNGTVNLFARDNIRLFLALFLPNAQIGYFKLASTLINLVMLPIEPFIGPTYAEITRTIGQHQWTATRKLLKQVSTIGGVWTFLAGGGLVVLGWWIIPFVWGSSMSPAYPCLVILLIGYAFANVMNWNRPLLLALGHPAYPLMVAAVTGDDEANLVVASLAKFEYQVERVIMRINNPRNAWLFDERFHVDVAINQAEILASLVEQEMPLGEMMTLLKLRRENHALKDLDKERLAVSFSELDRTMIAHRWHGRVEILCLFNLAEQEKQIRIESPVKSWKKILDSSDRMWQGPGSSVAGSALHLPGFLSDRGSSAVARCCPGRRGRP